MPAKPIYAAVAVMFPLTAVAAAVYFKDASAAFTSVTFPIKDIFAAAVPNAA